MSKAGMDTCFDCGKPRSEGELLECPYCHRNFCKDHYEKHVRWEKRHEGLEPTIKKKDLMKQWKVGGI